MPHALFEKALNLLRDHDIDAFVDLFAEDGLFELPFAEPGRPQQVRGRENLRAYLGGFVDTLDIREYPHLLVHDTTTPGTSIVEFTARGTTVPTGAAYEMRYIAVLTVANGEITGYRDYWSPTMAARSQGRLAELAATLRAEADGNADG